MAACGAMEKWRHLIEPTLAKSATPFTWDEFLRRPKQVYEGEHSVVVTFDTDLYGQPACFIWVAAGELQEVLGLAQRAEQAAALKGIKRMGYLGRSGFVRRAKGYRVVDVLAVKDLT